MASSIVERRTNPHLKQQTNYSIGVVPLLSVSRTRDMLPEVLLSIDRTKQEGESEDPAQPIG